MHAGTHTYVYSYHRPCTEFERLYSYIDMQTYSYVASYMLTSIRLAMCIAIATCSHDVCVQQSLTGKICRLLVSYITACISEAATVNIATYTCPFDLRMHMCYTQR